MKTEELPEASGEEQTARILAAASQYSGVVWQCWAFTARADVLVLCAHRGVKGQGWFQEAFLVFRHPERVCLPMRMSEACFGLAPPDRTTARDASQAGQRQHTVIVRSSGEEFRIVCGGVA